MMWELDDLASNSDLAEKHNVLRSTIVNWAKRYDDFPQPLAVIGGRQVWSHKQVAAWVAANCDQPDTDPKIQPLSEEETAVLHRRWLIRKNAGTTLWPLTSTKPGKKPS